MHGNVLQALLRRKEISNEIEDGHHSPACVLCDFCVGEFVQNHALVKENPQTLLLAFYFDDLESANPLGFGRGKHKLGMHLRFNSERM